MKISKKSEYVTTDWDILNLNAPTYSFDSQRSSVCEKTLFSLVAT